MTKFSTLDEAIELYEKSDYNTNAFIVTAITSILDRSVNGKNPMSDLIETADAILAQLEECGYEDRMWYDIVYQSLYSYVTSYTYTINTMPVMSLIRSMIDIRMVLSYAESSVHEKRYRLRYAERDTLLYNYYIIENKVFSYFARYDNKTRNIITNQIMVMMYNLKRISKYHCNMKYDLIKSVVNGYGNNRYY